MTPLLAEIVDWAAWAPGLETAESWKQWLEHPYPLVEKDEMPDLAFLPSMFKRRLGQLSRMVLQVGHALVVPQDDCACILASCFGEIQQQLKITRGLLAEDSVSPSAFSLSVFNTSVGLLSISEKLHASMGAVASSVNSAEFGVLDAFSRLAAKPEQDVILICADEKLPGLYENLLGSMPMAHAVAFRLRACTEKQGPGSYLTLCTEVSTSAQPVSAINLLAAVCRGTGRMGEWSTVAFDHQTV